MQQHRVLSSSWTEALDLTRQFLCVIGTPDNERDRLIRRLKESRHKRRQDPIPQPPPTFLMSSMEGFSEARRFA